MIQCVSNSLHIGNNGRFMEEVRRAVEDAGHAAQAVRVQRNILAEHYYFAHDNKTAPRH